MRLDMEGSNLTQDTIEIFQTLRKSHENVGIVLQAALHRTADDVKEAVRRGDRVRLCKGAYKEPPQVALQDMAEIRKSYLACAQQLLDGGNHPALATHDEQLISGLIDYTKALVDRGLALRVPDALRPAPRTLAAARGRRLRPSASTSPSAPTGSRTSTDRLRERKENVLFVLRNLFR